VAAGSSTATTGQASKTKPTASPALLQQSRRRGQRHPPAWREPAGVDSLAMLERLWGPPKAERSPEHALLDAAVCVHDGDTQGARRAAAWALSKLARYRR
jgi:hypothetical protein